MDLLHSKPTADSHITLRRKFCTQTFNPIMCGMHIFLHNKA